MYRVISGLNTGRLKYTCRLLLVFCKFLVTFSLFLYLSSSPIYALNCRQVNAFVTPVKWQLRELANLAKPFAERSPFVATYVSLLENGARGKKHTIDNTALTRSTVSWAIENIRDFSSESLQKQLQEKDHSFEDKIVNTVNEIYKKTIATLEQYQNAPKLDMYDYFSTMFDVSWLLEIKYIATTSNPEEIPRSLDPYSNRRKIIDGILHNLRNIQTVLLLPTHQNLQVKDFTDIKAFPIYFFGLTNTVVNADGRQLTPNDFFAHDLGHFSLSSGINVVIYESGYEFLRNFNRNIYVHFPDFIKIDAKIEAAISQLNSYHEKEIATVLIFDAFHESFKNLFKKSESFLFDYLRSYKGKLYTRTQNDSDLGSAFKKKPTQAEIDAVSGNLLKLLGGS